MTNRNMLRFTRSPDQLRWYCAKKMLLTARSSLPHISLSPQGDRQERCFWDWVMELYRPPPPLHHLLTMNLAINWTDYLYCLGVKIKLTKLSVGLAIWLNLWVTLQNPKQHTTSVKVKNDPFWYLWGKKGKGELSIDNNAPKILRNCLSANNSNAGLAANTNHMLSSTIFTLFQIFTLFPLILALYDS